MSITFNLKEAALFLKMSHYALREKAASGLIPGAKPGKAWCFLKEDLEAYLRSLYPDTAKTSQGVKMRRNLWHSTDEKISGGSISITKEREYNALLGLPTK